MLTLENFYSVNGIYEDKNHDGLPDGIRGKIYLQKKCFGYRKTPGPQSAGKTCL